MATPAWRAASRTECDCLSELAKDAQHSFLRSRASGVPVRALKVRPQPTQRYLTASEIAALKLDADWVILSACNTAADGAEGAEALSGLARAFIYAQARALLVSHWEVKSDATVKLITGAMSRIAADKANGSRRGHAPVRACAHRSWRAIRGAPVLLGAVRGGGGRRGGAITGMSAIA